MELLPLGKVLPTPLHTPKVTHGLWTCPTPVTNSAPLKGVVGVLVMGKWNFGSTFCLSLSTAFAWWRVHMCEWTPRPRGEALSLPTLVSTSKASCSYSNLSPSQWPPLQILFWYVGTWYYAHVSCLRKQTFIMIRVRTRSQIRNALLIPNSLNWQFRGPGTPISHANEKKGGCADSILGTQRCVHLRLCTMLTGEPCEASHQVSWFLFQKWVYYSVSD